MFRTQLNTKGKVIYFLQACFSPAYKMCFRLVFTYVGILFFFSFYQSLPFHVHSQLMVYWTFPPFYPLITQNKPLLQETTNAMVQYNLSRDDNKAVNMAVENFYEDGDETDY